MIEQGSKNGRGVEPRPAQPIDRAVFRDQGGRPAVAYHGIIANSREFARGWGAVRTRNLLRAHQFARKLMQTEEKGLSEAQRWTKGALGQKYSITLIAARCVRQLDIVQPQREGDGRQALVVPPLYPAPAASLNSLIFSFISPLFAV